MNVLMLCGEMPYPPHGGSRMRVYQFIRRLTERHRLTLLAYRYAGDEDKDAAALAESCRVVPIDWEEPAALARMRTGGAIRNRMEYARALLDSDPFVAQYFRSPAMAARLRELLQRERFDLLHIEDTAMTAVLPQSARLPIVLSIQNVEYWREERAAPRGWGARFEQRRLRRFERRAFARAAVCCPTSVPEAEQVKRIAPAARIEIVPNGVDTSEFTPGDEAGTEPTIVFTGTMSYAPNADGILWFAREAWSRVLAAVPDARLEIVGREPGTAVLALADDRIGVHGDVPDVRPYLHRAAVAIVPIREGGGTRLKILEAMACELPVVSTGIGAEGLNVTDGHDILIAGEPDAFAARVVQLLRDPALRARLGRNGRALVERRYDWCAVTASLERAYERARGVA